MICGRQELKLCGVRDRARARVETRVSEDVRVGEKEGGRGGRREEGGGREGGRRNEGGREG